LDVDTFVDDFDTLVYLLNLYKIKSSPKNIAHPLVDILNLTHLIHIIIICCHIGVGST